MDGPTSTHGLESDTSRNFSEGAKYLPPYSGGTEGQLPPLPSLQNFDATNKKGTFTYSVNVHQVHLMLSRVLSRKRQSYPSFPDKQRTEIRNQQKSSATDDQRVLSRKVAFRPSICRSLSLNYKRLMRVPTSVCCWPIICKFLEGRND